MVGPTATDTEERECPVEDDETKTDLENYARQVLPSLSAHKVMTSYAGLRPATEHSDYLIKDDEKRCVNMS